MTCKKLFLIDVADLAALLPLFCSISIFSFYAGQKSIYTYTSRSFAALMSQPTLVKVWNFPLEIQKGVLKHNFSSELKVSFWKTRFPSIVLVIEC